MKKVLIIGITIVAVIALGNVLLVSAQGGTQPNQSNTACPMSGYTCPFSGTMPYGGAGGMTLAPALRSAPSAGLGRGMAGGGMMGGNHLSLPIASLVIGINSREYLAQ